MNQATETSGNLIKGNGRKKTDNFRVGRKVLKNQVVSARREAAQIISEAEKAAEGIRRTAETEAENLKDEAYRLGTEKSLEEFYLHLLESREIRERVLRETEKDLLRLAVRLAEKIVGREIERDNKTIVNIVSTALQNARQQEKITVRVNPSDLPTIESEADKFLTGGRNNFIDFIADPRVSSGGCLIESEVGTIDARLETQIRVLERALLSQSEGESAFD